MKPSRKLVLRIVPPIACTVILLLTSATPGAAATPIKELLAARFGHEVNLTAVNAHAGPALEDVCTIESGDTCQPGTESTLPGGFTFAHGVAAGASGDIYITDDERVQELTASGEFVLMFGKGVDKTTGANVCTAASHDMCQAGTAGAGPGEFFDPESVTVDQSTGNVYVQDLINWRVQEFTASGQFIRMIGKNVNETKVAEGAPQAQRNICAQEEVEHGAKCQAGTRATEGVSEPSAFNFGQGRGDLLAIGPSHVLYVGDEHRVQEFEAGGSYKTEIPLTPISAHPLDQVVALAVDETGDVYLSYRNVATASGGATAGTIFAFNPAGQEVKNGTFPLTIAARNPGGEQHIQALAVDPAGRLAVSSYELIAARSENYAALYDVTTGRTVSEFTAPGSHALTINSQDSLYSISFGAGFTPREVLKYTPVPIAELTTGALSCAPGADVGSDATFGCTLGGEANPEGVSETEAWFGWGGTPALGGETTRQGVSTTSTVQAVVQGLHPNAPLYYRLVGVDHNVRLPELMTGETVAALTPSVPPRIGGESEASFVHASSAVLFGKLNPENASTTYRFQYGPCESLEACAGSLQTPGSQSSAYGTIGTTSEITELQPGTTYRYRLVAANTKGQEAKGPEGQFTTGPAPAVEAATGPVSMVGPTSAVMSGAVNPDGQAATYSFELGVYAGEQTQYGTVISGPAGAGAVPEVETFGLSGLQPGTTYAYRITIHSGYGQASGSPVTFTTEGLPVLLASPPPPEMVAVPSIAFPTVAKPLTKAQQLAAALKACMKKPKKKRVSCERAAHKKYGPPPKAKKK